LEGTATLVGKLLILIAAGHETSSTLAKKLAVSPRQVNRYVLQLIEAGWQIERVGAWTKQDYYFALRSPKILAGLGRRRAIVHTPGTELGGETALRAAGDLSNT
jgi:DNA-binding IclR family transcriptional regulator